MGGLIALFGAIVTIFGNYIFIPQYGFVASAYTTLAAYATLVILGYWFGLKYYPIPYQLPIILTTLLVSVGPITFLPHAFPNIHHAVYWILVPIYIGVLYVLEKRFTRNLSS
jgi:O-antigen/teichoic acid export membrane protein